MKPLGPLLILTVSIILAISVMPSQCWATTYYTEAFYVCHGGDGSAPKTPNCATAYDEADFNNPANWDIDDSNDGKIGPNDVVYLMDDGGSYTYSSGNFVLEVQQSGTSGKPITITNYPGDTPVIDGRGVRLTTLSVYKKSYIVIDGLTLQNGSLWGLYGGGRQSNVTIQNCNIEGDGYGVQIYNSGSGSISNITFQNNAITGSGNWGISLYGDSTGNWSNITISGNTLSAATGGDYGGVFIGSAGGGDVSGTVDISGNTVSQAGSYGILIDAEVGGSVTATTTINQNTIHDWSQSNNDRGGIHLIGFSGNTVTVSQNELYNGKGNYQSGAVYVDGGAGWSSVTCNVKNNYVHDCQGPGLMDYMADGAAFYDNIVENTGTDDSNGTYHEQVFISASGGNHANNVKLFNNTIYMNDNTKQMYAIGMFPIGGTISGTQIKNNIIYHDGAEGYDYIYNQGDARADIDYNLYWPAISTGKMFYNGTVYDSFAAWQAAGHDIHGKEANPKFTNAARSIFTLTSTSPAIDSGINLGASYSNGLNPSSSWPASVLTLVQDDYGTSWEIGAYVYREGDMANNATPISKPQNLRIIY